MISLAQWLIHRKNKIQNILFVFAHPDDEILCAGALLSWCCLHKFNPHVLIMTHGEKGISKTYSDEGMLSQIRYREFITNMKRLRIANASMDTLPDGKLLTHISQVFSIIQTYCREHKIDVIVTHDQGGGGGHPDHITISMACKRIASSHRLLLFYSVDPIILKRASQKMRLYVLNFSKMTGKLKMSLLQTYQSQISHKGLFQLTIRQLFTPWESYQKINIQKKIRFQYVPFQSKAYTFIPNTEEFPITEV